MQLEPTAQSAAARLGKALLRAADKETVNAIAHALAVALSEFGSSIDEPILKGILEALNSSAPLTAGDALWQAYYETRQPDLLMWLIENKVTALQSKPLMALSLIKTGQRDVIDKWWLMPGGGVEWVGALLNLCADADVNTRQSAWDILTTLPDKAVAARDEICRWVIEYNHPEARQIALDCAYTPNQAHRKALFFLLTGQWEAYEALDFDNRLLAAVMEAADEKLRRQIVDAARQAGWSGFVEVVTGARFNRKLSKLEEVEWEIILALLNRDGRWDDLWKLAQSAPPVWAARFLRSLQENGWQPAGEESRAVYPHLAHLAGLALSSGQPKDRLARYQTTLMGHRRKITALAAGSDWLASASADQTVRVWDLPDGKIRHVLEGHTSFVVSLAASPDGRTLVSGSGDQTVQVWDSADGYPLHVLGNHGGEVHCLVFSQDGSLLASADARSINLWHMPSGKLAHTISGMFTQIVSIGISPDGATLAALEHDKTLRLFRLPGGEVQKALLEPVVGWAFSKTGRLATSSSIGTVRLWDAGRGEAIKTLAGRVNSPHLVFDASGNWLACTEGRNLRVWHILAIVSNQISPAFSLEGHRGLISALTASPEGSLLASGGEDKNVILWQLPEAGESIYSNVLEGHAGAVRCLQFTAGGILASADDQTIRLWGLDDVRGLLQTPASQITLKQAEGWQNRLTGLQEGSVERRWVEFALELKRWHSRFDIEVQEAERSLQIGDYDIEIEFIEP